MAATAAALVLASVVVPATAYASTVGSGLNTTSATSGAWGVEAAATTVTSTPPCLTSPSSCGAFSGTGSGPWYVNLWNTGTVNLAGLSYVVSFSGGLLPAVTIATCTVAWKQSTGSCSGTTTTILSGKAAGTYAVTAGVPTAPASEVFVKATSTGTPSGITISTSVCSGSSGCSNGATSSQTRAAQRTNG